MLREASGCLDDFPKMRNPLDWCKTTFMTEILQRAVPPAISSVTWLRDVELLPNPRKGPVL
jgi:hypothetical protein